MKHTIPQLEKIVPTIRKARRALSAGSAKFISGYAALPRFAKAAVHIAACATFVWVAFEPDAKAPTGRTTSAPSAIPESTDEMAAEKERSVAETAREALLEAQLREEADLAEAQRIHAEQQSRLAAERIQARREQEAYMEQARYLQQLEMRQQQAAQRFHYEAQQNASEQANREMQRYRNQMTGRPGF